MSSSAPTKKSHAPNTSPAGTGLIAWVKPFFTISVGMKITTAITGLLLTGFVIAHLIGNLKVFAGQESINAYAKFLKDQGPFLWIARGGLLAVFVIHLSLALILKKRSRAARPVPYYHPTTIQASLPSRTMPWTGLLILFFVLFHLAHYTVCVVDTIPARSIHTDKVIESSYADLVDSKQRHDVYSMVVHGFSKPWVVTIYVVAMLILLVHLSHGIASAFQSLGANTPRFQQTAKGIALGLAAALALGNSAMVIALFAQQYPEDRTGALRTTAGVEDVIPMPPPGQLMKDKAKDTPKNKGKDTPKDKQD